MELKSFTRRYAFFLHLLVSLSFGMLSACLVFFLWYPGLLAYASNVTRIFLILLSVDVVLGPVITLIIFNPKKKKLKLDLVIIAFIQLMALLYGLHTLFITRPVYIAFNADRFDVVYANDIPTERLEKVTNPDFQRLPFFGPKLIASPLPNDPDLNEKLVMGVISGTGDDVQYMPEYYAPYVSQKTAVLMQIKPLNALKLHNKDKVEQLQFLMMKYQNNKIDVGYIPIKGKVNNLTMIVNRVTGEALEKSDLRPWP